MSTRCTIVHDKEFHLYQECFEQDNVYLQLDSGNWSASLETSAVDWRYGNHSNPQLHVKIDVEIWRKIVEGWMVSHWGRHPEEDHRKPDTDDFGTWTIRKVGGGDEG